MAVETCLGHHLEAVAEMVGPVVGHPAVAAVAVDHVEVVVEVDHVGPAVAVDHVEPVVAGVGWPETGFFLEEDWGENSLG